MVSNYYLGYSVTDTPIDTAIFEKIPEDKPKKVVKKETPIPLTVAPMVDVDRVKISNHLKGFENKITDLKLQLILIRDLMAQEDADDVYGVDKVHSVSEEIQAEWNKLKECLLKELKIELLGQTSKPMA